ncbi:MAG: TetR/AcrR family transcriptional regulator [Reyranella sp.]
MVQDLVLGKPSAPTRRFDGRRLRSERTRQLIIEAYLHLLAASVRAPTASQIAEQAGYSVRSIFERFADLRALGLAAADHAIAAGQAAATAEDIDGDRPTRIRAHVRTRAIACQKWLPLWRAMIDTQEQLAELKDRVALVRRANLARLTLMYGPELSALPSPERKQMLFALGALTSFESWNQLRVDYGLSMEAAQAVWCTAIDRMLPATPPRTD